MKKIDISTPKHLDTFALVDDEDFKRINKWKWAAFKSRDTIYAIRKIYITNFPVLTLYMHREIMRYVGGKQIDHKNHNGVDNQKHNLRVCTSTENCMNRYSHRNSTSIYKGVHWNKATCKWMASIRINKKFTYLGLFKNEEDAAEAYNESARINFKEFAHLNKIKEVV